VGAGRFGLGAKAAADQTAAGGGRLTVALSRGSTTRRSDQVRSKDSEERSQPSQRRRLAKPARASSERSAGLVEAK
jgi:hypothetical protein